MLKIRLATCLIFNMDYPHTWKDRLYIETGPRPILSKLSSLEPPCYISDGVSGTPGPRRFRNLRRENMAAEVLRGGSIWIDINERLWLILLNYSGTSLQRPPLYKDHPLYICQPRAVLNERWSQGGKISMNCKDCACKVRGNLTYLRT